MAIEYSITSTMITSSATGLSWTGCMQQRLQKRASLDASGISAVQ